MLDERYYSGRHVQQKLNITEPALRNLVQQGKIQKVHLYGRKHGVYLKEEIDAFAEQWMKVRSSTEPQKVRSRIVQLNMKALGARMRAKRAEQSLRTFAAQLGISASTLDRLESGKSIEAETFLAACYLLQVSPETFTVLPPSHSTEEEKVPQPSSVELIGQILYQDICQDTARALHHLVRLAYEHHATS